jgi:hypothetical protein
VTSPDGFDDGDAVLIDPLGELGGIEPDEMTNPNEGNATLGHEASDVADGDAQGRGDGLAVDEERQVSWASGIDRYDRSGRANSGSLLP